MTETAGGIILESPYCGLRPFDEKEAHLFFGRQDQMYELLRRLDEHRFVAIVGASGSGKSSLVRAGLIPALRQGYLSEGGGKWRIASLRPGSDPLTQLDKALSVALGESPARVEVLHRSSFGLIRASRIGRSPDENLLILVDQFEDVFRHSKLQSNDFVRLLLTAVQEAQPDYRIYIVLTMRTDYIGDCAQFRDLPEALNDSQYLVPRMTRAQCRMAIEEPAKACGGQIETELLQQLLIDTGDDQDQLPILQHLLMRMWDSRKRAAGVWNLTLDQYEQSGGWSQAINKHGQEILDALPASQRAIAKRIFQRVTEIGGRERDRRRLTHLSELYMVCSPIDETTVRRVVEHFSQPGANFSRPWTGHPTPIL